MLRCHSKYILFKKIFPFDDKNVTLILIFLELSQLFSKKSLDHRDLERISEILKRELAIFDYDFDNNFLYRERCEVGKKFLHIYAGSDNDPNAKIICSYLVRYGVNVNSIDNSSKTALHRAVYACNIDITILLLNFGAYVNAQDENQDTPLHIASTRNLKLCHWLLNCGADPNIKNSSHDTPILLAVNGINNCIDRKQVVELLLRYGGNALIKGSQQHNVIELAFILHDEDLLNLGKQNEQNSTGKRSILLKFFVFSSCESKKYFSGPNLHKSPKFRLSGI